MFLIGNTTQTSKNRIVKLIRVGSAMCSRMSAFENVGVGTNPLLCTTTRTAQERRASEVGACEPQALAILRNNDDVLERCRLKHQPITFIDAAREAHPPKTAARDGINKRKYQ